MVFIQGTSKRSHGCLRERVEARRAFELRLARKAESEAAVGYRALCVSSMGAVQLGFKCPVRKPETMTNAKRSTSRGQGEPGGSG